MGKHSGETGHVDNTAPGGSKAAAERQARADQIKRDSFAVPADPPPPPNEKPGWSK